MIIFVNLHQQSLFCGYFGAQILAQIFIIKLVILNCFDWHLVSQKIQIPKGAKHSISEIEQLKNPEAKKWRVKLVFHSITE
jgi:hypothetical protein